ncbi:MAG TPA: aldo/keto reductase [Candidatus Gemmiger stercorigallinarum]|nr:aldo/keto reductase [Candidatus Gemmiger stercorigallinarum]
MQYVSLGSTGLQVSRLGFGGIPVQRIDQPRTRQLLEAAHKAGINYIDTARAYTVSEEWIGQALQQSGLRDEFVIATKCRAITAEEMAEELNASLRSLRTDHIELYQFHNPSPEDFDRIIAPGGALEALKSAHAVGIVEHIGVTAHLAATFEKALACPDIETIMFPYNIVEQQGADLIARCKAAGKAFIAMKPLAGGAIESGRLAIRYTLANPGVTVVIPGMAELRELSQNVAAAEDASPLTEEELAACEEVRKSLGTQFCRRCNYCAPCTVGIQIPNCFLFQGYLNRYGLEGWAHERYNTLPVKAGACIECGACETRCPYQLPIRQMLKKVAADFGE